MSTFGRCACMCHHFMSSTPCLGAFLESMLLVDSLRSPPQIHAHFLRKEACRLHGDVFLLTCHECRGARRGTPAQEIPYGERFFFHVQPLFLSETTLLGIGISNFLRRTPQNGERLESCLFRIQGPSPIEGFTNRSFGHAPRRRTSGSLSVRRMSRFSGTASSGRPCQTMMIPTVTLSYHLPPLQKWRWAGGPLADCPASALSRFACLVRTHGILPLTFCLSLSLSHWYQERAF